MRCPSIFERNIPDDDTGDIRRQRVPSAVQGVLGGRRRPEQQSPLLLLGLRGGRLRVRLRRQRLPRLARRPQGTRGHLNVDAPVATKPRTRHRGRVSAERCTAARRQAKKQSVCRIRWPDGGHSTSPSTGLYVAGCA